jgi:hypothetical protein
MINISAAAAADNAGSSIAVIGDKGRAQIGRSESARFVLTVQEAYKNKVTFAQVRRNASL